ncbi:redoxin domain-containing protein [Aquabacterium humicola]|uniref:redoxin domain-containing protein n=1 Tax=Aquabacterium humicola TaxID=3237377 RepID=UPI002542FCB2|nr:redoxin domain-containing protein [Rubrivivax pictus]
MSTPAPRPPVGPGEAAPPFALPAVARPDRLVTLDDYRDQSPLFLALMVGLWCPFCRRQLVQLAAVDQKLKALGVQSLAVVATAPENAQVYFRFRPTTLMLASDPALATHRAYGVPKPEVTPALLSEMEATRINPFGDAPAPMAPSQLGAWMQQRDGYQPTPSDQGDVDRQWPQLKGQFLIDRHGIVRWAYIECATEGLAGLGKLPTDETILAAAQSVLNPH